jgi:two-component system, OmpR family, sensor kinase
VQQLLHLARLAPEAPTVLDSLNLTELAKQAITEYTPLAEAHSIDLGLTEASPAQIMGEAGSLRMLLDNLLDNAIKYTPPGGCVDVTVHRTADGVALAVSDTGPGIPPEEHTRVFERFYRSPASEVQGSGLGLAIVKRVAKRHGATVRLTEGEGGRGLTVRVVFNQRLSQVTKGNFPSAVLLIGNLISFLFI